MGLSLWLSCVPGLLKTPVVCFQLENWANLHTAQRGITQNHKLNCLWFAPNVIFSPTVRFFNSGTEMVL